MRRCGGAGSVILGGPRKAAGCHGSTVVRAGVAGSGWQLVGEQQQMEQRRFSENTQARHLAYMCHILPRHYPRGITRTLWKKKKKKKRLISRELMALYRAFSLLCGRLWSTKVHCVLRPSVIDTSYPGKGAGERGGGGLTVMRFKAGSIAGRKRYA